MKKIVLPAPEYARGVYTIPEICRITGLSKSCVTNQIHRGALQGIQIRRKLFVLHHELERYLESDAYRKTKEKAVFYKKYREEE
ncbi:MAG: helix-turn-helix domain-containing protein [Lachnospiraceae bacterium]|nr:helix-turn-helix domain-containing protein [Lachnospiraceae bacterium]